MYVFNEYSSVKCVTIWASVASFPGGLGNEAGASATRNAYKLCVYLME